jgi:hypothetical protein
MILTIAHRFGGHYDLMLVIDHRLRVIALDHSM